MACSQSCFNSSRKFTSGEACHTYSNSRKFTSCEISGGGGGGGSSQMMKIMHMIGVRFSRVRQCHACVGEVQVNWIAVSSVLLRTFR